MLLHAPVLYGMASMKVLSLLLRNAGIVEQNAAQACLNESPELIAQESRQKSTSRRLAWGLNESLELIAQHCASSAITMERSKLPQ